MNPYYPHLYEPIKIGSLTFRSRLIASPSSQNDISPDGTLHERNIAYYGRKAKGGAAAVTVGDGIVDSAQGKDHPFQLLLDTDNCLPSMVRCAEEIHRYGAFASVELSHGGACCDPAFIGGRRPIGPSEVPVNIGFQTVEMVETRSIEMTVEMMEATAEKFAQAAVRAKKAGFDMCCVHGGHGWLLGQFLSPNMNLRTDEYGGSIENRCRFPIMVCKAVRAAVGRNFPIEYRINGDDMVAGGLHIDEAVEACRILEPYVDAFHVSAGVHYDRKATLLTHSLLFLPRGHLLPLAAAVKKAVKVPVITVGGHAEFDAMEQIVASGQADIVAMARQLLADPDAPNKARQGRTDEIRRCLRCGWCQAARFTLGTARCTVNPDIGQEYMVRYVRAPEQKRKVLIAGGGPAGMQAAITATEQGHKVTLFEKGSELGGALRFAKDVPFKCDLYDLVLTMKKTLERLGVDIRLNTELTPEIAKAEQADVIIAALGTRPIVPPIPGIDKPIVQLAAEIGTGEKVGKRVVLIGGGLVGCETAIHMAQREGQENEVTIVEMLGDLAGDCNFRYKWVVEEQLELNKVKVLLNTSCVAVNDDGVTVRDAGGVETKIVADTVILAAGMRSLGDEALALRECAPEFRQVGDCVRPGQVTQAVRGGYEAAFVIE